MARKHRTPSAPPAQIEDLRHPADVTRRNIPTAETESLMAQEEAAPTAKLYPRNPDLDPQLVWHGKDELDAVPLRVPTVPIYIQEKVLPAALIRDLRRVSKGCEPQADLFGSFDRISDPEMRMEFYQHGENWSNRMILGDSLLVMNSLAEKEGLRGQVQCIYFDPPYGIRFASNWQPSTRTREVKEGRVEGVSLEPEVVAAFRDTWKDGIHSYLTYLRDRLVVARELLTESGSVFVQIGDEYVHRVRALMDEVFGPNNFCAEIAFTKTSGQTPQLLASIYDVILWYARDIRQTKFHRLYSDKNAIKDPTERYVCVETPDGEIIDLTVAQKSGKVPRPAGEILRLPDTTSQTGSDTSRRPFAFEGKTFTPSGARGWSITDPAKFRRVAEAGRLFAVGQRLRWKAYFRDQPVESLTNQWTDLPSSGFGEDRIYVVQTQPLILQRCVLMTTDPGDLVLDPTCGSGTTAWVAEQWGRRWITTDTSRVALALARTRLTAARHTAYLLRDSEEGACKEGEITGQVAVDGPFSSDLRQGFVLERVPHVQLGDIANNAEIDIIHAKWQPLLAINRAALAGAFQTPYEEDWQVPRKMADDAPADTRNLHEEFWRTRRERQREIDSCVDSDDAARAY